MKRRVNSPSFFFLKKSFYNVKTYNSMKKGFRIYLFRHGQTTFNRDGIFTGLKDARLTSLGRKQARAIALMLKKKKIEAAFFTKLSRSKETLKEVLKFHPECRIEIEDDQMIERSYGNLAGHHHSEIIKRFGGEQYEHWHRGFGDRPPKGESFSDVEKRVSSFIKDLRIFIKKNRVNVAISAHGNSIRLFRKIWEKKSEKEAVKWSIPYNKVFTYTVQV
jgi:broad specificity phosphatase PhoE